MENNMYEAGHAAQSEVLSPHSKVRTCMNRIQVRSITAESIYSLSYKKHYSLFSIVGSYESTNCPSTN